MFATVRLSRGGALRMSGGVGEGRVVWGRADPRGVEGRRDDGEGAPLAATSHREVLAVPLRVAGQEVVGPQAAQVDAAVVVAVAVVPVEGRVAREARPGPALSHPRVAIPPHSPDPPLHRSP